MKYTIHNIDGLTVITAPVKDSTTVIAEIYVKAWSIYETKETNGLSHFLEHMFFKWSGKFDTPKKVSEVIESFGGRFNAYTGSERAWYYIKSAPDYLDRSLEILGDLMCDPIFDPIEVKKEQWVVIQEIKMYEDEPRDLLWRNARERYVWDNSYWWSILWPEENVASFTQQDLFNHKNNLYAKDNLILVIAGNIQDEDYTLRLVKKYFASLPKKWNHEEPFYTPHKPKDNIYKYEKWVSQNHLIMYADGFWRDAWEFNMRCTKILSKILGGNTSSRLWQKLREEMWLCYYIWSWHGRFKSFWTFQIWAWLDKNNFNKWVQEIYNQLDGIVTHGITEKEFDFALNNTLWSLQMGIETSDWLSDWIWDNFLLEGKINTMEDVIKQYKSISIQDIKNIIPKLAKENRYLAYID